MTKNRKLKFRAWDIKNKTWSKWIRENSLAPGIDLAADESFVYQQYTGLKDNKGVEIYEGDIINFSCYVEEDCFGGKNRESSLLMEICFGQYKAFPLDENNNRIGFYAKAKTGNHKWIEGDFLHRMYFSDSNIQSQICISRNRKYEIIGNIFDNPELLK